MADSEKGAVGAGFSLLWRRQEVLWWVFAVNFFCGALGTTPATLTLRRALHHSLAGQPLTNGFDLGMLDELMRLPNISLMRSATSSYLFAFVFFLFMLFVSGGILETYRQDRRMATGDFFAASGAFFWRFVRLLLLSIVPFVVVGMIYQNLDKLADYAGNKAIADQVGIYLSFAAGIIFLLLALLVRLWFDLAKVATVAHNQRVMWHSMWAAWGMIGHNLGTLFWMYFRISLIACITLAIGLVIWVKLPPTATPATFALLELILLAQLITRLWQLASATVWYTRHTELAPGDSVDNTLHRQGMVDPAPHLSPSPETELPPASA